MSKFTALRQFWDTLDSTTPPPLQEGKPKDVSEKGDGAKDPPEKVAYDKERAAVEGLHKALLAHKQAAHVKDLTDKAKTALDAAASEAAKPDWPAAMGKLGDAKKHCEEGKGFADKYADYLTKHAEANLALTAAKSGGWIKVTDHEKALKDAENLAKPPDRKYADAKAKLQTIIDGLGPTFKTSLVDNLKTELTTLKGMPGKDYIATEIAEIEKLVAEQETLLAAKEWRK